jgi:hypothetical protein
MILIRKPVAPLLLAIAIAGSGFACRKADQPPKEKGVTVLSASAVVHGPNGAERKASIEPGQPMALAEGEWTMIGTTKYVARSGGGQLRLEDGQIKATNVDVTDLTNGR